MEQSHASEGHGDAILVASLDDIVVADATASLRNIADATLVGTLDVVAEGEECIRAQGNIGVLGNPRLLLLTRQRLGFLGEELLPCAFLQEIFPFVGDIHIDAVVAVGAVDTLLERQRHHLRALAQPPFVGLAASESRAVDAALLTSADTNGLAILDVADRVALRVLQRDERNHEVALGLSGKLLVLRGDIGKEGRIVEVYIVAQLLKGDAKHLLALDGLGHVVGVDFNHVVGATALCHQYLQSLGRIVRRNHAVAHLSLDEPSCSLVASVAQRAEITIGAHAVGTACTGVGRSQRSEFEINVVDEVYLLQRVAQRQANGCTRRTDVLKTGGSRHSRGCLELLDELPAVERIKKIDVAGTSVQHFYRELAMLHVDAGGLLIRITSVLQSYFFHFEGIYF